MGVRACVRACACVSVRACVRACVCACARACFVICDAIKVSLRDETFLAARFGAESGSCGRALRDRFVTAISFHGVGANPFASFDRKGQAVDRGKLLTVFSHWFDATN